MFRVNSLIVKHNTASAMLFTSLRELEKKGRCTKEESRMLKQLPAKFKIYNSKLAKQFFQIAKHKRKCSVIYAFTKKISTLQTWITRFVCKEINDYFQTNFREDIIVTTIPNVDCSLNNSTHFLKRMNPSWNKCPAQKTSTN